MHGLQNKLLLVTGAFLLLTGCSVLFLLAHRPNNGIWANELEADLNQRLPDGSTWEEAEAWFAAHGLRPIEIIDVDSSPIGMGVRIPNDSWLDSAEIRIELYFNEKKQLKKRVIYRFVYHL